MNESEFAEEVERYETEKKRLELYDQVEVYEEYLQSSFLKVIFSF